MNTKAKYFLAAFALVSALQIASILSHVEIQNLITKPLLVLTLIGYYYYAASMANRTFILALFFCWMGDVLLLFVSRAELFFIFGLVCFLIGHVLFITVYRSARWKNEDASLMGTQKARFAFPIILAGSGLVITLYPYLGDMKIPVMVYALVITFMVLNASFRSGRTSRKSYWLVLGGAFLFMTSDTILALNKFQAPFPSATFYVMATYIAAQFLIVEGIIQHPKEN